MATGRYHLAFVKFYVLDFSSFCISPPHSTFRVLLHSSTARDCAIEPALLLCSWLFVYMVYVRSFFFLPDYFAAAMLIFGLTLTR